MILDIPPTTAQMIVTTANTRGVSVDELLLSAFNQKTLHQTDTLTGQLIAKNHHQLALRLDNGNFLTVEIPPHLHAQAANIATGQALTLTGNAQYQITGFSIALLSFIPTSIERLVDYSLTDWVDSFVGFGASGWQMDNALSVWQTERHQ